MSDSDGLQVYNQVTAEMVKNIKHKRPGSGFRFKKIKLLNCRYFNKDNAIR